MFFEFLHRRLVELQNVQITLAQLQPSNYGTMSAIILHLMRFIMVTPRISHKFLRQALQHLQFRTISDRFGMFFLHKLKIKEGLLEDILSEDTQEVRLTYAKALTKKKAQPAHPHKMDDANDRKAYPWGPSPSWTRIQELLDTEPESFLRKWKPDSNWKEPNHQQCTDLFILFTRDLWLSLAEGFASLALLPKPKTLEEAMQSWTVPKIKQILGEHYCRFTACAHGLTGKLPPNLQNHTSFLSRRTTFFPDVLVEISGKSIWKPYTQNHGYISKYHNYIKEWRDEEVMQLNEDLDMIFSHLQCLPPSTSHSIWTATRGKVIFVTNSTYYKVESVGGTRQADDYNERPKRPQASIPQLKKRLHKEHSGGSVMASQGTTKTKEKSKKSRGRRQPPQNAIVTKKASTSTRKQVNVPLAALQNLRSRKKPPQEMEGMEADEEGDSEDDEELSGGEDEWSSKVDKLGNP